MHVYLFAQSFRVAIKVIMLAIKLGQIKKKKVLSHVHPTTCFRIISVVSLPKCFSEPFERRKPNCEHVCGSLCLRQMLKSEGFLMICNQCVKKKKYYPKNSK